MTDQAPETLTTRLEHRIEEGMSEERELFKRLRDIMVRQDFEDKEVETVDGLVSSLEELFLLVIVGEVKAGKSTFINSLMNAEVCKVGAIPTTDKIHILKYGPREKERVIEEFLIEKQMPFDALRNLNIVDTPGTNSIVKRHAEITEDFIPRCDLVLFTTSVDRPYSETERQFLSFIFEGWAKKIIFILTKKDIKEAHELDEIHDFVRDSVKKHYDIEPTIFSVSAKQARKAKETGDDELYAQSGFKELEEYLFDKLSHGEKLQLKLESPINSALSICERSTAKFKARLEELKDDRRVLDNIKRQLDQSETDMSENFGRFILEIDNVILEMEKRGRNWVDDNVKLTNMGMLRSNERFRARFKEDVLKDYEAKIDEILSRAVDWFMKKYIKVWNDTTNYFTEEAERRADRDMVGNVGKKFEYNREKIYDLVRADAKDKIKSFDYDEQIRRFMGRSATGINTAIGGGLIGIGAGVATVALTTAAGFTVVDVTGILAGITILGGSLFVLPMQRRKIKAEFSDRVIELKSALTQTLDKQIKAEAREAIEKITEGFGPFFDYVDRSFGGVERSIGEVKEIKESFLDLKRKFGLTLKEEADAVEAYAAQDSGDAPTSDEPASDGEPAAESAADEPASDAKASTDEKPAEPAPEESASESAETSTEPAQEEPASEPAAAAAESESASEPETPDATAAEEPPAEKPTAENSESQDTGSDAPATDEQSKDN